MHACMQDVVKVVSVSESGSTEIHHLWFLCVYVCLCEKEIEKEEGGKRGRAWHLCNVSINSDEGMHSQQA